MSSPNEPPVEPTNRGIFDGFEGYRTATRDDHVKVLKEGLVVIDANVLLDLYRYGRQGRVDLLAALRAIGDRLWVPNHAMVEFWRNREGVLKDPGGTRELVEGLKNIERNANSALVQWGKMRSHPEQTMQEFSEALAEVFGRIIGDVADLSREETETWARDTSKDEVLSELSAILDGKIGRPLSEDEYKAALAEAKRRGERQIPPGYKDAKKPEPHFAGDYLVWEQLLIEAAERSQDVLFITRDAKEDWVRVESGETRGPRIELQDELRKRTGRQFYLRTPVQLLELAQESLAVTVSSESVEDAVRISDQVEAVLIPAADFSYETFTREPRWDEETAIRFLGELSWLDQVAADATKLAVLTGGKIGHEILAQLGITPEPLILRQIAASIEEQVKRLVQRQQAPIEALHIIEPVRRKQPNGESILVAYNIRKEFLFDLLQAVQEPDSHLNSSAAVMAELSKFLKHLKRLGIDRVDGSSD